MTHEYTLLIGGTVIPGGGEPDVTAIAWAEGTVLALGSDTDVRALSRGDSYVVDLRGAVVVPLGRDPEPGWPTEATLEIGGRADLAILDERSPGGMEPAGSVVLRRKPPPGFGLHLENEKLARPLGGHRKRPATAGRKVNDGAGMDR